MTNYDKRPVVRVDDAADACLVGWDAILPHLATALDLCVECYPGAPVASIVAVLRDAWPDAEVVDTTALFRDPEVLDAEIDALLGDDPVFARFSAIGIHDFLDETKVAAWRAGRAPGRRTVLVGPGAATVLRAPDRLVYVAMARWELQQRQRRGEIANLGGSDRAARAAELYRRAFFVDWRVGDAVKYALLPGADFVIEANGPVPRMIAGDTYHRALDAVAARPFRVVPFFDAGPWGGQWVRRTFDLPEGPPNYAWCFDCVPEENSLLLGFGEEAFELPALDLVRLRPDALLGGDVIARFGAEFPIRFDLLDTMEGGNLSLQVHPRADYARAAFGLPYTQDESYYLLDAGADACVYLGLTDAAEPAAVAAALTAAQAGGPPPDVDALVNRLPARAHDHFLIPAGTIHCSGCDAMVLEISATPYIFTFKLWDWGRLGLDGRPRPIHLEHGLANIDWTRRETVTRTELVNRFTPVASGSDWRRERTGLHPLEFIETERAWFETSVALDTAGTLNVLNLVAGTAAMVESPDGAFAPFEVHYAETFVIPAALGRYRLRSLGPPGAACAVMRAWVRPTDR
ncbi:class I mannose-6-phosphate isomerase [Sphingomonas yunnanensis]|uniref:class I mannose-6-phosphate isomerase n=1 Tax=Sphingomonas yunnanensis TaxID=310400 RepID=UPI001CA71632|nr:class I mannose-6-phosphate isomerase [Sphingomonas yunnanensis]MBY9063450.1 class I mannose-6-phosphate isomerase [Sphingomonas yunnanensis]